MSFVALSTCQRCNKSFDKNSNTESSCLFHRAMYVCRLHTEGKAYYGVNVDGWDGRFWDCCGKEEPNASPCAQGKHVSYDELWTKDDDLKAKSIKSIVKKPKQNINNQQESKETMQNKQSTKSKD
eukprot:205790_1